MSLEEPADDYLVHYFDLTYYKWIFVLAIGVFLALFMLTFQPFGVTNYDPDFHINLQFILVMLMIGAVVSTTLLLNEFMLRPLLIHQLTRRKVIAWLAWDFVLVSSVVFLFYNYLGDWHDFHWLSWLGFVRDVGLVLIFPVVGFVTYIRHESLSSRYVHLHKRFTATAGNQLIHLTSDNDKDRLAVSLSQLLYLESQDNYLAVVYLENGIPRSTLLRSTLKRIEAMAEPQLLRCHRSFMVNLSRVVSCDGNLHGLKLKLDGVDKTIPVSRAYTRILLEKLGGMPAK